MLKTLLSRSILGVAGLLALAIAAMGCVVAGGYGLYGLLRLDLSPAAAAGFTALGAAVLVALLALAAFRLAPAGPVRAPTAAQADPALLRQVVGVGAILASLVADTVMQHRRDRSRDKRRHRGARKRRG